ncbi:MAG: pyridoxal phosphate-dependent aminotransferase [Candidatus Omnitrophota bacterium]|jgi:aspartate aminotransferase|nr:pyridoxal phosphate-dependent aminotransferase [Candidatus Omnitrophota bacterium]MDD3983023.1 pyridoxal phosphate-dependent aminotransferase [Candidatus Omnitrophota bacterium]MDD5525801.1 pyridoxal phosphate-dependent aminotransferase [Candidatus Omnitrophota bacterium]
MRIDTRIAERLKKIKPSSTLAITSKARKLRAEGKDVVSFAAGEPDADTPDFIKAAAIEAINSGFTKYTPSTGIPELKKLISEKFKRDNGLDYKPEQVVVSCGAKHSIFNVLMALVDPGDEVLIPSPYWVSYPEMVHLCGGLSRFVKTAPENGFRVTAEELNAYVSPKTKVLILNSPSNPAGSVYNRKELLAIAELCAANKIFVISDEIYEKLIYDGLKYISIAGLHPEMKDLAVTVNGVSKTYAMTGWRIGYLGAPADVAEAIGRIQDHTTSNPSSISQKAALAALKAPEKFTENMRAEYAGRRDYMLTRLNSMPGLKPVVPQGAFYVFCDISGTGMDSGVFSGKLLEDRFVAVIPGEGFGRVDYIRFSFATGMEQIKKGMDRIEEWVKTL